MVQHPCKSSAARRTRAGPHRRVLSSGTFIPGKNITLGVGTIRGVESRGMRARRLNCKSPTITMASWSCRPTRRSGARYARMGRARRSHVRDQFDSEPAGLAPACMASPRSFRRRHGQVQRSGYPPGQGRISLPVKVTVEDAGLCPALRCGWCAGSRTGVAEMAATAADLDRLADDQTHWSISPTS